MRSEVWKNLSWLIHGWGNIEIFHINLQIIISIKFSRCPVVGCPNKQFVALKDVREDFELKKKISQLNNQDSDWNYTTLSSIYNINLS